MAVIRAIYDPIPAELHFLIFCLPTSRLSRYTTWRFLCFWKAGFRTRFIALHQRVIRKEAIARHCDSTKDASAEDLIWASIS
jgi:hypothetical protein